MARIYLSPPEVTDADRTMVLDAIDSNWIAPLGPHVDAFERELAEAVSVPHAAALSSGTAGLHLALRILGVGPGDEVIVPTLTFVATAAAATYLGATPVFIDADPLSWNLDPDLLAEELSERARRGRLPRAVIVVDLYGQCVDYDRILPICAEYEVPVVEDAAEALGATYRGRPAGSFGDLAVFSFNGNKIITTSGGGMLVSTNADWIARARHLATQARDPAPHYQHSEVGYNYRLSNILAALGRAQLHTLRARVQRRREINQKYRGALAKIPGIDFMPRARYGDPTFWLSCITIDAEEFGASREEVRLALERRDIEARPTWKPLHLQPAFVAADVRGGGVAESVFRDGLCLPSGSSLTDHDIDRVTEVIRIARR